MLIRIKKRKKHNARKTYSVGDTFETKYGPCIITNMQGNSIISIRFVNTGYEKLTRIDQVVEDRVKDNLVPSVYNVGYLGQYFDDIKRGDHKLYIKLHKTWSHMLSRCYCESDVMYGVYGGNGVTVDKRWYDFSTFFHDAQKLSGYSEEALLNPVCKSDKITLDKDKLQYNCKDKVYSYETCCWLTQSEQANHKSVTKDFMVIHPNGISSVEHNISEFARRNDLNVKQISACLTGRHKSHKGYSFIEI